MAIGQNNGSDDEQVDISDESEPSNQDDILGKRTGKRSGTVQDAIREERETLKNTSTSVNSMNQRVPLVKPTSKDFKSGANEQAEEHLGGPETWGRARKRGDNNANEAVVSNTKRKTAENGNESDWSSPER